MLRSDTKSAPAPPPSKSQARPEIAPIETIQNDHIHSALDVLADDPRWRAIWRDLLRPVEEGGRDG